MKINKARKAKETCIDYSLNREVGVLIGKHYNFRKRSCLNAEMGIHILMCVRNSQCHMKVWNKRITQFLEHLINYRMNKTLYLI